jgi:hypothetical protein
VIPMTVLVEQYWHEISTGLAQHAIPVHFVLHADQTLSRGRIERAPSVPIPSRISHAEAARTWLHAEAEVVDTTHLTAARAAPQIARAVEVRHPWTGHVTRVLRAEAAIQGRRQLRVSQSRPRPPAALGPVGPGAIFPAGPPAPGVRRPLGIRRRRRLTGRRSSSTSMRVPKTPGLLDRNPRRTAKRVVQGSACSNIRLRARAVPARALSISVVRTTARRHWCRGATFELAVVVAPGIRASRSARETVGGGRVVRAAAAEGAQTRPRSPPA